MPQNFIACDRDQELLLPPNLREWLPEDHLAWFVLAAVEGLEVSAFVGAYRADGHGRPAHDPALMWRIQPVVATPNVEGLRCPEEAVLLFVLPRQGRVPGDVRLLDGGNIGSGSG